MRGGIERLFALSCVSIILLGILLIFPLQAHAHISPDAQNFSYTISGSPTVSATFIDQVLAANNSPAAGNGQAIYNAGIKYGIDPVFALAFFMHESSFGKAGIAQFTLSPGNLRCIPNADCVSGYAAFPSWNAGFDAWYQLIRNLYINTWNLTTVEQIIPRYAPPTDNNDDTAYINNVENAIYNWRVQQITTQGPISLNTTQTPPQNTTPDGTAPILPPASYPADGYTILGKPTINTAFINEILTRYHSPAMGKGSILYDAGVKAGIDPIYALAFFMHDSTFGTIGIARVTHALGTITTPATTTCHCQDFHGYRQYKTWEDGFNDWYQFIQQTYISQNVTTIGQIVPDYAITKAPSTVTFFIKTLEARVDTWHKEYAQQKQAG